MSLQILRFREFDVMLSGTGSSIKNDNIIDVIDFQRESLVLAMFGTIKKTNITKTQGVQEGRRNNNRTFISMFSFCAESKPRFLKVLSNNNIRPNILIVIPVQNKDKTLRTFFQEYKDKISPVFKNNCLDFGLNIEIQSVIRKISHSNYTGQTQKMFLKSQFSELVSHFFAQLLNKDEGVKRAGVKTTDRLKLYRAKDLLYEQMVDPPSLDELAEKVEMNNYKLKKGFKELFGVPPFKYLQLERLDTAYGLIRTTDMRIQEVAWAVGYESVSSFSNMFTKKFGFRPSELAKYAS